jgi:hypothetical protein
MTALGKTFILIGCIFVAAGLLFLFADHLPFWGKLPGDISIEHKKFRFYFPVTTCLIISIILTILFSLFKK